MQGKMGSEEWNGKKILTVNKNKTKRANIQTCSNTKQTASLTYY
jgi:hypothetical protein